MFRYLPGRRARRGRVITGILSTFLAVLLTQQNLDTTPVWASVSRCLHSRAYLLEACATFTSVEKLDIGYGSFSSVP